MTRSGGASKNAKRIYARRTRYFGRADCTLYGPAARIREGVEQWRDAGITTPVLVPLSPDGSQMNAAPTWHRISPAAGRST